MAEFSVITQAVNLIKEHWQDFDMTKALVAVISFFSYPVIKHLFYKWFTRHDGRPEIWYLPGIATFRFVIRNLPRRRALSDIKIRSIIRKAVPKSPGVSVTTWMDIIIENRSEFVTFPGNDEVLISFRLENIAKEGLKLIITDKLGAERSRFPLGDGHTLICDYVAKVENFFSFEVKIQKRAEVSAASLRRMFEQTKGTSEELFFRPDRIREVG